MGIIYCRIFHPKPMKGLLSSFFLALHTILPLFLIIFFGIVMIRLGAATPAWVDMLNKYALRFSCCLRGSLLQLSLSVDFLEIAHGTIL